ncbi:MAG: glycosyltransferase family 39 protein [Candidatus Omnitrophica bacterium]|jgi:hypothetical protein|nr:glycosyltransferase family 39 protein [Candidatus Omnitrophota bacterium]
MKLLALMRKYDSNFWFIFLVYSALRLFLPFQAYWIWGDEAKYLACARSFPFNRMFNHSFYDYHPVFYPYMIRFFNIFFNDHIAAIAVSFFSSVILFFVIYHLFMLFGLKKSSVYMALVYLAFNNILMFYSKLIFRYELFVCLFFLSFYMYVKGLTTAKYRFLLLSAIFGGLTFMTSDIMPFTLLPVLLGAFFIFRFNPRDKLSVQINKLVPIFLIVAIYCSCVILPKYIIYTTHTYYAGGLEGRIERVCEFGLKQLLNPIYFPNSNAVWGDMVFRVNFNFSHIAEKLFQLVELHKYRGIFFRWTLLILMVIPVFLLLSRFLFPFGNPLRVRLKILKEHRVDVYLFIIVLGIVYPVIYEGTNPRYSIAAIPFMAYFLVRGIEIIFSLKQLKLVANRRLLKYIALITIFALAAFTLKRSHNFIFTLGRVEACDKAGEFLNKLPKDGVLAEGLLSDALVYNCNKRVVTLPRSSVSGAAIEQTDLSIKIFDLHYILLSEFWKIESLAYPAIHYIRGNPDKFRLIGTVYENYDKGVSSNAIRRSDFFYIYEVQESFFSGK